MPQKIFVLGDMHLKNQDHLGVITKEGINSRLLDKIGALDFFVKAAIKEKAKYIILLGDIFHGSTVSQLRHMTKIPVLSVRTPVPPPAR